MGKKQALNKKPGWMGSFAEPGNKAPFRTFLQLLVFAIEFTWKRPEPKQSDNPGSDSSLS